MADNVAEWADGIYQSEKELLLYAIEKRSHFTVDMIQWIAEVSTTLLRISTSVACSGHSRDKLREQARWLVSVLSWVPGDSEAVWLVESSRMTETLFEAAAIAQRLGCPEHAGNVCGLLLSWAFKGGRHEMGWGILERSVYGLATLVLLADDGTRVVELKEQVAAKAMAGELPSDVVRDRAALEIRTRAASLDQQGHWLSPIEREMAGVDREGLRVLLEEIADLISPDTKGEISVSRPF